MGMHTCISPCSLQKRPLPLPLLQELFTRVSDGMNPAGASGSEAATTGGATGAGAAQVEQRSAGAALSDFVLQLEDYTPTVSSCVTACLYLDFMVLYTGSSGTMNYWVKCIIPLNFQACSQDFIAL